MNTKHLHFADLFESFAIHQQNRLSQQRRKRPSAVNGLLQQLLVRYDSNSDRSVLHQAMLDPYLPLGMLTRTIFADVVGMRFYINKRRPDLEPAIAAELLGWARAFLRIRFDIQTHFDPETITCIPVDGTKHPLPSGQWCTLCGVCCQIGGVPPNPPPGIQYPDHWYVYLSGKAVDNQQLCPFLFQYFGEPFFFCSIHNIKPVACRTFDQKDCKKRLTEKNLHS